VTGVGGQYDFEEPYDEYYQILPRFISDFQGEPGMPVADAGANQVVELEDLVTLDGSFSYDTEDESGNTGNIVAYEWTQTSGETVTLSCNECENGISTFTAPTFDDELVFRLTVWDNEGNDDEDYIMITVSDPITIYDIQYTDVQGEGEYDCYPSPLLDEEVTTTGIVTAIKPGTYPNFYLSQSGVATWSGIYVYDTSVDPQLGDEITLTATVGEYGSGTQLTDVSAFTTISSGNSVTPITVTLEDLGGYECNLSGEGYESMLIKVNNVTVDEVNEFGDWVISDGSGQVALVDDYLYDGEGGVLPDPPVGSFSITGIINSYYDYKIEPRFPGDIDESSEECPCALGDLNCDGNFNVLDIVVLANCILSQNCADDYGWDCAGDMNGDGGHNVLDVVGLASCVLAENCGGRVDDASHSELIIEDNVVSIKADGFIGGVQMTLTHGDNFSIEMADRALFADYLTTGNETRLLVITPETDKLFSYSGDFKITEIIVANSQYEVSVDLPLATSFSLGEAYPNPFNPTTTMTLIMPVSGDMQVDVYNLLGQSVAILASGYKDAGRYNLTWDATDVSSGMYFVKAEADGFTKTQKLMLMK